MKNDVKRGQSNIMNIWLRQGVISHKEVGLYKTPNQVILGGGDLLDIQVAMGIYNLATSSDIILVVYGNKREETRITDFKFPRSSNKLR